MRQNAKRGFTLIELLVVIAVIALIAAILFPVFAQARETARAAACLSNLKQIGTASLMYAQDYDDTFLWNPWPPGYPGAWNNKFFGRIDCVGHPTTSFILLLSPYLKSTAVFHCPDYPGYFSAYQLSYPPGRTAVAQGVGYGFNSLLIADFCRPVRLALLRHSLAEVALFADAELAQSASNSVGGVPPGGYSANVPDIYWRWIDLSSGTPQQWYTSGRPRHHGGIHFAYADGHAKWGKPTPLPPPSPIPGSPLYDAGYYSTAKLD